MTLNTPGEWWLFPSPVSFEPLSIEELEDLKTIEDRCTNREQKVLLGPLQSSRSMQLFDEKSLLDLLLRLWNLSTLTSFTWNSLKHSRFLSGLSLNQLREKSCELFSL